MSLADIKKKIEADAGAEAQRILNRAQEQAAHVAADTEREVAEMKAAYDSRFEGERPEIIRRREIVAKLDVKKTELGAQQTLIDEVFAGALEAMRALPAKDYLAFVERILNEAVQTGDEEVVVGKDEKHLNEDWLKGYNERHETKLVLSAAKAPISGGIVLNRGNVSENASFDMLVRWIRDDLEADVVKRLFSK